ncbi:MAG: hypothetical protein ACK5M7_08790 [Draconibacterium sp.]
MKRVQGQSTENNFSSFNFDVLTTEEMRTLKGGIAEETRPKSRDRDVFDTIEG